MPVLVKPRGVFALVLTYTAAPAASATAAVSSRRTIINHQHRHCQRRDQHDISDHRSDALSFIVSRDKDQHGNYLSGTLFYQTIGMGHRQSDENAGMRQTEIADHRLCDLSQPFNLRLILDQRKESAVVRFLAANKLRRLGINGISSCNDWRR